MEKMQDPKMCWAFPLPGRGVVVAVYPSHALISLQWYGSYPGFKRVILLHCSIIFQVTARQRASDSSFIYPGQSKSSLNYAFAKGLVELGLYNWGFLYVIIFEIIFLWYYAEEDPTPKDIPCLKNWRRTFEICENSDTVKKTLKRQWKTVKTPWKPREKTVNTRKIRFVQKGWFCDFVPTISHICSRSMWLLLILWWGNCKLFNLWLSLLWSFRSFIQTAALNSSSRPGTVIRYSELCCALVLPNFFFGLARLLFEVRFCLPVEKMVARLPSWLPSLLKYWS